MPITGTFSVPRRHIAYSAGKICRRARSPVMPNTTSASDGSRASVGLRRMGQGHSGALCVPGAPGVCALPHDGGGGLAPRR